MNSRKVLSAISHGSIYFSSILLGVGVPLVIMLISDDPVVQANSKEALNAHINLIIAYVVFGLLCLVLVGIPFLAIAGIYNLIMPLVAICSVATRPDEPYRYPMMFHILGSSKALPPPATKEWI